MESPVRYQPKTIEVYGIARLQPVVDLVVDGVDSRHSKRAYRRAIRDFLTWYVLHNMTSLDKATVNAHKQWLIAEGIGSVNQRLSAIRSLAREAADHGLIDQPTAAAIQKVKGIGYHGQRRGNWLTHDQAQSLLDAPDASTLAGKRDRALLATMLGSGLRREEVASLLVGHLQQREGRWALVDIVGKRNKVRSVPIAAWVYVALSEWLTAACITDGRIFRSIDRHGRMGEGMTPQAILYLVRKYAGPLVAPHDLRRTFAKLSNKAKAPLEQISLVLGHENLETTIRYLGLDLDWHDSPSDYIKLDVGDKGRG